MLQFGKNLRLTRHKNPNRTGTTDSKPSGESTNAGRIENRIHGRGSDQSIGEGNSLLRLCLTCEAIQRLPLYPVNAIFLSIPANLATSAKVRSYASPPPPATPRHGQSTPLWTMRTFPRKPPHQRGRRPEVPPSRPRRPLALRVF